VQEGVAWITLARPALANRLDADMQGAIVEGCEEAEAREDVRVVVLAARGATFSTGLPAGTAWPDPSWPDAVATVAGLTKPTVAAVQGEALGWGMSLALACDLRVASSRAVFVLPEVERGRLPGGGVIPRLVRMVGVARTLDLVLLGTRLAAAPAAAWGLVSTVVPPARLATAVGSLARALVARGPLALRLAKEAVVRGLDLPLDEGMRLEHDLYVLLQTTVDRQEGVRAFLEGRRPRYHAR
jgi:enoyl-CoA hydratase/carnithine racemase